MIRQQKASRAGIVRAYRPLLRLFGRKRRAAMQWCCPKGRGVLAPCVPFGPMVASVGERGSTAADTGDDRFSSVAEPRAMSVNALAPTAKAVARCSPGRAP